MSTMELSATRELPMLDWTGIRSQSTVYEPLSVIFAQGDYAGSVFYLQAGTVRLSVLSRTGKEAVMAVINADSFFGEGCMAGQSRRIATATTVSRSTVLAVEQEELARQFRARPAFAKAFLVHVLTRNIRVEEDLLDQLFNSIEKRLARTLLLLIESRKPLLATQPIPRVSQEILAEMVGTTRSRVNYFMNKFRKLGFINYEHNGELTINDSLMTVLVQD